jgi:hypothetical protein
MRSKEVVEWSQTGADVKEWLKGQIIASINYAHAEGLDKEEFRDWKWPGYTIPRRANGN